MKTSEPPGKSIVLEDRFAQQYTKSTGLYPPYFAFCNGQKSI